MTRRSAALNVLLTLALIVAVFTPWVAAVILFVTQIQSYEGVLDDALAAFFLGWPLLAFGFLFTRAYPPGERKILKLIGYLVMLYVPLLAWVTVIKLPWLAVTRKNWAEQAA